ncbi:MAG: PocR ligand-binding domain-containing protein [Clostridia bacterium]|nr:PocR ligand-binding domain-containing protein [Clostridia bacterium]
MVVTYDIQKITRALQDFYNATGINMNLLRTDFSPIRDSRPQTSCYCRAVQTTEAGVRACRHSDRQLLEACTASKKAEMHICHAGLVDLAIPILFGDDIIGYIIFGEMKSNADFSAYQGYLSQLGLATEEVETLYRQLPLYDSDKIDSVSRIAIMLVKHLLLENMLKPDLSESVQKAVAFINENLEQDLSIHQIAKGINVSKSALYKKFHEHFHCTVSKYINTRRVEKSMELLAKTNLSIEEISQRVGFSSASYYSKMFKKQIGVAPLKYRKEQR